MAWIRTKENNENYIIKDNDVSMTQRAGINFTDFDIADDETNNEIDISTHKLTDAELAEICSPLPGSTSNLPVLFDETGAEYVIGLYKRASDGKVKPIYRKTYIRTGITNGTTTLESDFYNSNSVEYVTEIKAIRKSEIDWSTTVVLNDYYNPNINYSSGDFEIIISGTGAHWTCRVSIEYTKTTDEWKEE